jgi:hypothetical protein
MGVKIDPVKLPESAFSALRKAPMAARIPFLAANLLTGC